MPKTNRTSRTPASTERRDHDVPWPRLVSTALLTGALRHLGGILTALGVTWWHQHHD
ncbi:hypothetical protein ACWFQ6_33360 [Streptomyces althioticus]